MTRTKPQTETNKTMHDIDKTIQRVIRIQALVVIILILLVALLLSRASASHRPNLSWMTGMYGNGPCCDDFDCTEATVIVLQQGPKESIVMIGTHELTIPSTWLHPSQDSKQYWCFRGSKTYKDQHGITRAIPPEIPTKKNTRCVFYHGTG